MWRQTNEKKLLQPHYVGKKTGCTRGCRNHAHTKLSSQSFLNKGEEKGKLSTKPQHLPQKTQVYLLQANSLPHFNSQIQIPYCFNNDKKSQKGILLGGQRPQMSSSSPFLSLSKRWSKYRLPMRPRIAKGTSRWWERWKWGDRRMRGGPLPKWRWTFGRNWSCSDR